MPSHFDKTLRKIGHEIYSLLTETVNLSPYTRFNHNNYHDKGENMLLEPNAIVLYVDNLAISSTFYQDLLGIKPVVASPTFNSFTLSNGMGLGLKARHAVEPVADRNGSGELAFTLDNKMKVDELFAEWENQGINIVQPPTVVAFGYTFLALDPDGNRLRVVSLNK